MRGVTVRKEIADTADSAIACRRPGVNRENGITITSVEQITIKEAALDSPVTRTKSAALRPPPRDEMLKRPTDLCDRSRGSFAKRQINERSKYLHAHKTMDSIGAIYARAHVRAPMETIHIRYKSNSDTRAAIDIIDVIINTRVARAELSDSERQFIDSNKRRELPPPFLSPRHPLCTFLSR
jgi:hypothetical protein